MNEEKTLILIVDDDPNIAQLISLYLAKEGFATITAGSGADALQLFSSRSPSLVLLDIMLPVMDGWEVCRSIRSSSKVPIIMLSAKDETIDKVLGLELGADDYITKPFDGKELVARVRAVLRRYGNNSEHENLLSFNGLQISIDQYEVTYRGNRIDMPPKELELLFFLAGHRNIVFTREQLLEQVWGFDFFGDSRTVDVHIKRLREKLEDSEELGWQLKTVWGVGYKFECR